jgi:hypothetical protein
MSYLFDNHPQGLSGAYHFGGAGLGVLGSVIRATTATGTHGPGYLYNDWDDGSDDTKQFQGLITTFPSAGTLVPEESGAFSFTDAPDGVYTFSCQLYVDGVDEGTVTATITIGATGYRLTGDTTLNGWTAVGAASVAAATNEAVASDAEYGLSPDLTSSYTGSIGSMPAGTYTVSFRADRTLTQGQMRIRYLDAGNVDVGGTAWQVLTGTATTYNLTATTTATATQARIEVQP